MIISITVYLAPHHRWGDGDRPVNTIVGTVGIGMGGSPLIQPARFSPDRRGTCRYPSL